jgi:hypothetical protein
MTAIHEGSIVKTPAPGVTMATVDERPSAMAAGGGAVRSPTELIEFAIANKLPAAELKELVGLHERMEDRIARRAFFEALRNFQRECPPIKKNKTATIPTKSGGSYSFKYAELDEIERHVKPYLDEYDLAYSFDTSVDEKGTLLTNVCTLRHTLGHSERSSFTLPTASESAMTHQQRFAAANNFAKRQTLAGVLGISITDKEVPDEDVDPTTIDEDRQTEIADLLKSSGANEKKFFGYLGVAKIADIRVADYAKAKVALHQYAEAKRRKERAQ